MNTIGLHEFFGFLIPQNEPIQLFFFIPMVAMFIGTIVGILKNANTKSWENNWINNTPHDLSDDLGIGHGSITDLSDSVATKSEKIADVMPSLLLVVGLLGTFFGLGLALNHASNILQPNNLNATDASNNMSELMGMMHGLGTKFKTSTWGILFFLLFNVFQSSSRYKEKRISWVIKKLNAEFKHRKEVDDFTQEKKNQLFSSQIDNAVSQIVNGFASGISHLSAEQFKQHENLIQGMSTIGNNLSSQLLTINTTLKNENADLKTNLVECFQSVDKVFSNMNSAIQRDGVELRNILEHGIKGMREDLNAIISETNSTRLTMKDFVENTTNIIKDMSLAGKNMAEGANKVGQAGKDLVSAIGVFNTKFEVVLDNVRSDLSKAINNMSQEAAKTLSEGSSELGKATEGISKALGILSNDVNVTMNGVKDTMEKSLSIQERGAVQFNDAVRALHEQGGIINNLGDKISNGLGAVSDAGRRMEAIGKNLQVNIDKNKELYLALEALKTPFQNFQNTVDEVKGFRQDFQTFLNNRDIGNAVSALHEQGAIIKNLGEKISSGLGAVSDAGRRMEAIGKNLQVNIDNNKEIYLALEALKTPYQNFQNTLDEIKGMRQDFQTFLNNRDISQ